jgi:hypothetical protein
MRLSQIFSSSFFLFLLISFILSLYLSLTIILKEFYLSFSAAVPLNPRLGRGRIPLAPQTGIAAQMPMLMLYHKRGEKVRFSVISCAISNSKMDKIHKIGLG